MSAKGKNGKTENGCASSLYTCMELYSCIVDR
jgi:hypothetical protein